MVAVVKQRNLGNKLQTAAAFLAPIAALALIVLVPGVFPAASPAAAQEPNASPTKDAGNKTTINTTVRQVLLDVVVTDGKNHPVTGLQQEDFSLLEDGEPRKLVFFEAHAASSNALAVKPSEAPTLPPNTFGNSFPASDKLPLNVLLYDLLNTPTDDQPFAHKEVLKFLLNRPTGGRFAIFVLADTLHLLQGFTDDDRQLVGAMHRKEASPHSPAMRGSSDDFVDPSEQLSGNALFANNPLAQALLDRMGHIEALRRNYFLRRRVGLTIAAFSEIAQFLGGFPGRKNLIWLSGSFPVNIFPSSTDPLDPFGTAMNYTSDLRQVADLFTVGQVAVYPVDIRGLAVDPLFAAANSQTYRTNAAFLQAHANFLAQIAAEQGTMDQIADDSGGHAFYNTNGLAKAIATSIEDGANYYMLAYTPSNTNFDGRLRKIRVQLTKNSYYLAYRHSYLADDSVAAKSANKAPVERLQAALRRGMALAHELVFEAHVALLGQPRKASKAEIAQLSPFPAFARRKKWDGAQIQRYAVDYVFPSPGFSLETAPNGTLRGRLELLFGAYDSNDQTMFGDRTPAERAFTLKSADEAQRGGYHMRQVLEVPSGAAWFRLAVRDVIGDRLGSIEVPLPLMPEKATSTLP